MNIKPLEFEAEIIEIEKKIADLSRFASDDSVDFTAEISQLKRKSSELLQGIYTDLTPWQITQVARHPQRPYVDDYINLMMDEFVELHGDRQFGDDRSIITGMGRLNGMPVMVIGQHKGREMKENLERNFGMPRPEGYRKALRAMQLAEKFNRPLVTFIDTPGAYPGLDAEERGQGEAIARNLRDMAALKIPIVVCIVGEGGSGGALGIGIGDRILMLQYSIYSVISPEGCASILWRDAAKAEDAAKALRITAPDLIKLGIIDRIVPEPAGGAHRNHEATAAALKSAILEGFHDLRKLTGSKLVERRMEKFRRMGPVLG